MSFVAQAEEAFDLNAFAQQYYKTMTATQAPNAGTKELEAYLALLTDDIGNQHIPYQPDDSRTPDGKEQMRKGMSFYLGAHTFYKSTLLNTFVFNNTGFAIRYKNDVKGIHPQNKQPIEYTSTMLDVIEIENGKVAMIRKYHE
ncbi:nuclear transport factor 2 family protein [Pseudoalteromonas sp. SG45-5]|uniref:nuclear transport factor 2 family protein n=1 Tax=unclassified Pseudoalteromonas TaxID=194690 RepID=UPI0015F93AA0|nr:MULTISPECIES: nuclear transport factor 2 family protein [unclassified Pseudoalteromonas]MBB1387134.1 nuclear transport factor 2 family protein [Pseudoalteromonas sp. SG45-5]MBB1395237.1 nuclear transport factor 2 family protein [Pseudoalteromonas sp. SG44-4]MBB1447243.1 nuclear transport factor 2 family protein [Pseudoalteromonas sp. SG41-6]